MSSQTKPASRWGSFLQQAVAGVESRLDTILADDESVSTSSVRRENITEPLRREAMVLPSSGRNSGEVSRQPSTSKKNDSLQERLAKAVVNRNTTRSTTSSARPSRTTSPARTSNSPRPSEDIKADDSNSGFEETTHAPEMSDGKLSKSVPLGEELESFSQTNTQDTAQAPQELVHSDTTATSIGINEQVKVTVTLDGAELPLSDATTHYENIIDQMRADIEAAELKRQEEIHEYLERNDALQAKLKYLASEAADTAKTIAEQASPGSSEKRIAQQDEKIALLMEEGQKLSQNEMKQLTNLKKLRAKLAEEDKKAIQMKRTVQEMEVKLTTAEERAKRSETLLWDEQERSKGLERKEQELEKASQDSMSKSMTITRLEQEIVQAKRAAAADEAHKYKALLETEKQKSSSLEDELAVAKVERELGDDRHRAQLREIQGNLDHEKERGRVLEIDLRGEISVLETRLETYRTRAEEVSSDSGSDAQVNLFRQIETLQRSYSVASENWRGIEGSLLGRISNLEKERDDLHAKETELRRKARDASLKHRQADDQIEQCTSKIHELEEVISEEKATTNNLQSALKKTEITLGSLRSEFESEKAAWESRIERLELERREQPAEPAPNSRGQSPVMKSTTDRGNHQSRRQQGVAGLGLSGTGMQFSERTRKSSGHMLPTRVDSFASGTQNSSIGSIPETPPIPTDPQDDAFDGIVTPATPDRTINDMFSVSTAAAGPSVQLVENLSSSVRSLRIDNSALKEELNRLSSEKDESRAEVVSLLNEVEDARNTKEKLLKLETELEELQKRYDTTLQLLGERVEEANDLRADVEDMKRIWRDTISQSVGEP